MEVVVKVEHMQCHVTYRTPHHMTVIELDDTENVCTYIGTQVRKKEEKAVSS